MSTSTGIEWTRGDDGTAGCTWNPIAGCTPVSPGCLNCYAATMSHRLDGMGQAKYRGLTVLHNKRRTFNGKISFDEKALLAPLSWKKPRRVFVNSMSDLFHPDVPFEFVDRVFAVMALCPQHTFQVLTKRPERMAEYLTNAVRDKIVDYQVWEIRPEHVAARGRGENFSRKHPVTTLPLPNVWLGASVEDRARKSRIDDLRRCPAAVRFLSLEPLLEDLGPLDLRGISWVIAGGESGPKSRSCNIEWIRSIVGQCKAAGVACFVKQLGAKPESNTCQCGLNEDGHWKGPAPCFACAGYMKLRDSKGGDIAEFPTDLRIREFPGAT